MSDNAYGCATDAVTIRRNAFLAIFTSIEVIFLNVKKKIKSGFCTISDEG